MDHGTPAVLARGWGQGHPPDWRLYWCSPFRGQFDSIYKNSRYTYHLIQQIPLLGMYPMEKLAHVHKDICTRSSVQMSKLESTWCSLIGEW